MDQALKKTRNYFSASSEPEEVLEYNEPNPKFECDVNAGENVQPSLEHLHKGSSNR